MTPIIDDPEVQGSPESSLPTHSSEGVDLTLIRWALRLTPAERLETMTAWANSLARMANAADRQPARDP